MTPPPKPVPNTAEPNRARVGVQFMEGGDLIETMNYGWAVLGFGWVHFLDDEMDSWCSYPTDCVYAVEWL